METYGKSIFLVVFHGILNRFPDLQIDTTRLLLSQTFPLKFLDVLKFYVEGGF